MFVVRPRGLFSVVGLAVKLLRLSAVWFTTLRICLALTQLLAILFGAVLMIGFEDETGTF